MSSFAPIFKFLGSQSHWAPQINILAMCWVKKPYKISDKKWKSLKISMPIRWRYKIFKIPPCASELYIIYDDTHRTRSKLSTSFFYISTRASACISNLSTKKSIEESIDIISWLSDWIMKYTRKNWENRQLVPSWYRQAWTMLCGQLWTVLSTCCYK